MAAFFRGLLLFLFGAIAGAAGILFLTPSFQVDVRRGNTAIKPLELGTSVAQPTPAPVAAQPVASKPPAPAPASVATAKPATPVASVAPAAPITTEPSPDFVALSRHLILWPTAITVKSPTTVAVNVEGQPPQALALEAGAVLQLTRVLPSGQLEVRAKGAKFEIKSTSTDFAAELGKRVTELVAKGTKFDSPYPTAATVAAAPAASASSAATVAAAAPVVTAPKRPLTLAERIDVLYGRKAPEPAAPAAAPVAPASPAPAANAPAASASSAPAAEAPAPVVAPAPATREAAKVEEKGKDLDRKMNQLFK